MFNICMVLLIGISFTGCNEAIEGFKQTIATMLHFASYGILISFVSFGILFFLKYRGKITITQKLYDITILGLGTTSYLMLTAVVGAIYEKSGAVSTLTDAPYTIKYLSLYILSAVPYTLSVVVAILAGYLLLNYLKKNISIKDGE